MLDHLADLEGLIPHEAGLVLASLASDVPASQAIVELGSYKGKSACYLASGARLGSGAHVWAIDAWDTPGNITGRFGYAERTTFETFRAQVAAAGLEDQITAVRQFSTVAAGQWANMPDSLEHVGLLFIDADHTAQSVRQDFHAWTPHLIAGAVVVFDDLDTPRNPGVRVVVDELVAAGVLDGFHVEADRLGVGVYTP